MKSTLLSLAFALTLSAAARAGPAPPTIDTIQVKFSDGAQGNVVLVTWEKTAPGSAPADILVDGSVAASTTSQQGSNTATVTQVSDGQHLFEVIEGASQLGFISQEVLSAPPMGDIVDLDCTVDEDDCEIVIDGESPGPPSSYVEFIIDGVVQPQQAEMTFDNDKGVFTFSGAFPLATPGQHEVLAYATGERGDGFSFENGSYRLEATTSCSSQCGTGGSVSFVPGLCNGIGTGPSGRQPDISSAVFGLSWLFAGTRAPPCAAACDANGDGQVDISDMVRVLNYLFSGGLPPEGWVDSSGDGVADPTCRLPTAGEDCAAGHDACGG